MLQIFAVVCATLLVLSAAGKDRKSWPVVVDGVVKSIIHDDLDVDWNWVELGTPSNTVPVGIHVKTAKYDDLRKLVDAEVRVTGKATHAFRLPLSGELHIIAGKPLMILRPPPPDPFSVPSRLVTGGLPHRIRWDGTVLATRRDRIFMRSSDMRHRQVEVNLAPGERLPPVGSHIAVVGFVQIIHFGARFCEALVKVEGATANDTETPLDIDGDQLFTTENGPGKVNSRLQGTLIRMRGIVLGDDSENGDSFVLRCGERTVRVDMSFPERTTMKRIRTGSTVEVVGVCRMEFEDAFSTIMFPRFRGFVIIPRTDADIREVSGPPWNTSEHLAVVTALLLLVTIAILIWNRMLKTLSERRGKELYREQIDHARAELKVEERTRLAVEIHDTMSQILTGVSLQIDAAIRVGKNGFAAAEHYLETARQMLASCRHELRCCIWDLRSRTFEERDMTEAVERTVAPHAGDSNVSVRFNVPRAAFSDSTAHVALRIIRELVVNAIRHGHASHIRIAGEFRDGVIRFSVRDDGVGFDPESVQGPAHGHFGLQGIRERLDAISGNLEIESSTGTGTKVMVSFPAEKEEA